MYLTLKIREKVGNQLKFKYNLWIEKSIESNNEWKLFY